MTASHINTGTKKIRLNGKASTQREDLVTITGTDGPAKSTRPRRDLTSRRKSRTNLQLKL